MGYRDGGDGANASLLNGLACEGTACAPCQSQLCRLSTLVSTEPRHRGLDRGQRLNDAAFLKLCTVLEGLVGLCTALPDGRRQVMSLSAPGDTILPAAAVHQADVWIEAFAPSRLCELDLSAQPQSIGQNAVLSTALLDTANRQIKCVSAHLVTLGRLDGMERVCLFLTDMAWRIGIKTPGGWRVHLPLSREDIADYLGLNAETVSRIFSRVKKSKLVTFLSPTDYMVTDIEALQSRAPVAAPHAPPRDDTARQEFRP